MNIEIVGSTSTRKLGISMSIIGIDIGTSAIKIAAFQENGGLLLVVRMPVNAVYPSPGMEEMNPDETWQAVLSGLTKVANSAELKGDPPVALAISASGDEVFLVDQRGNPLTPCILSGDVRGGEVEAITLQKDSIEGWYTSCGHIPERMDPVNRLVWWQSNRPDLFSQTHYYLGWHEFIAYRLCGRAVIDPSLASKWLTFDLSTRDWLSDKCSLFDLNPSCMPQIQDWGQPIGEIRSDIAAQTGLPPKTLICVGAFDSTSAALGSGVSDAGIAGLACGSWQVVVAPTVGLSFTNSLLESGFPITPYPGRVSQAVLAQSPNGTAILDWLAQLVNMSVSEIEIHLSGTESGPGSILSIPHFSGAINSWKNGRDSRGAFLGVTLATSRQDMLKALMESGVFDLHLTLKQLERAGALVHVLRASGGGSRSAWWMQLIADLTGIPVQVAAQTEPGAFGAALLAGTSIGLFPSISEAAKSLVSVKQTFEPNPKRQQLYADRMELYQEVVGQFLSLHRKLTNGKK